MQCAWHHHQLGHHQHSNNTTSWNLVHCNRQHCSVDRSACNNAWIHQWIRQQRSCSIKAKKYEQNQQSIHVSGHIGRTTYYAVVAGIRSRAHNQETLDLYSLEASGSPIRKGEQDRAMARSAKRRHCTRPAWISVTADALQCTAKARVAGGGRPERSRWQPC